MLYYHLKKKINNFNTDNIINHEDIQEDKDNKRGFLLVDTFQG